MTLDDVGTLDDETATGTRPASSPAAPAPLAFTLDTSSGPEQTPIVIIGNDFGAALGRITINEVPAPPLTWTDQAIQTSVPYGATSGDLVVTTADGRTGAVAFRVTPGRWTPDGVVGDAPA